MMSGTLGNQFIIGLVLIIAIVAVVAGIFYMQMNPASRRKRILTRLKTFAKLREFRVLENVTLSDGRDGKTHADFAIVGYFGVLFLTVFTEDGDYYGEESAEQWLLNRKGVRQYIPNPLHQGEKVMDSARKLFAKNKVYNVSMDHWVIFASSFKKHELAVKESLQIMKVNKLGSFLGREVFEEDRGLDIAKVADLLGSGS